MAKSQADTRRTPSDQEDLDDAPFRAIADFTYDWETWVGPDGGVRWVNPAVERIAGYSVEECLAMPDYPLAMVHEDDRPDLARHLAGAAAGQSGNHEEFRILCKDGTLRWGAVSWQPIFDRDGRDAGYRTSVRDITDTKRFEAELQEAYHRAEKADRAKTHFLAAASHDLRQPLQAIAMFTASLNKPTDHEGVAKVASRIQECIGAANEILGALLDVSRLDAGVLVPRPSDFLVCDLLETIEIDFAPHAEAKGLALRVVTSSVVVRTDPALLKRIVSNLVANAVRYTDAGRILVGCKRRGDWLRLEVRDTGIGIEPAARDRIFEEFFQAGNPERDRRRGLGLGLAIVQRLSHKLQLPVEVESRPGVGSVFSVDVPLAASQDFVSASETPAPHLSAVSGRKILVIDDDPVQLDALSFLLGSWGCNMLSAAGIGEAKEIVSAEARPPDAILADYRLRGKETGSEAINEIRQAIGIDVPGLIVTGDTEPARLKQAAKSGFKLLAKPVDATELLESLTEAMSNDSIG